MLWHPMAIWTGAAAGWTYTFQRWWKWRNNPEALSPERRLAFERSPWSGMIVWTSVLAAATCTLLAHEPPAISSFAPWLFIAAALSAGYAVLPRPGGEGLRGVPGLKLPVIALTWGWATVVLPQAGAGADPDWAVFAGQILFIAGLTLPFDVRDAATDPPGLRTLPQRYGAHSAIQTALVLLASAAAIFVLAPGPHWGRVAVALIAMPIVAAGVRPRQESYYTWALDGLLLLTGPLAAIW